MLSAPCRAKEVSEQQPVDSGMMRADARLHRLVSQNKYELLWQLCQALSLRLHLGV
jgi:hypothetical protein